MTDHKTPNGPPPARLPGGLDFAAEGVTPARPAATVVIVRQGAEASNFLEIFCVERHRGIAFMGGAVVFPGGKVDPSDTGFEGPVIREPDPRGCALVDGDDASAELRALAVAACREAIEEAAIAPAFHAGGTPLGAAELSALRAALEAGAPLADALVSLGAALDLGALTPLCRWVTPEAESRRYDTRFFLLQLPPGQEGLHDGKETTHGFWDTAAGVLARFAAGEVQLAPPTTRTLELLRGARTLAEAQALALRPSAKPICPVFVPGDPPALALPGDPAHPVKEVRVDGPSRFVLRDGRFVSEDAPPPVTAPR